MTRSNRTRNFRIWIGKFDFCSWPGKLSERRACDKLQGHWRCPNRHPIWSVNALQRSHLLSRFERSNPFRCPFRSTCVIASSLKNLKLRSCVIFLLLKKFDWCQLTIIDDPLNDQNSSNKICSSKCFLVGLFFRTEPIIAVSSFLFF